MDDQEKKRRQRYVRRHKVFPDFYEQTLNAANRVPSHTRTKLQKVISTIRQNGNLANDIEKEILDKAFPK